MNTRKQILVVAFLAMYLLTSTAQAGWFDDTLGFILGKPAQTEIQENTYQMALSMDTAMIASAAPVATAAKPVIRKYTVQVSGYNSEVAQTDDSPFITANGSHVRDGIVAANMFPFGTIIKIPSLYGDKIFVVEDRMNKRYQNNVDIWFANKSDALKLGRRMVQIEVIK